MCVNCDAGYASVARLHAEGEWSGVGMPALKGEGKKGVTEAGYLEEGIDLTDGGDVLRYEWHQPDLELHCLWRVPATGRHRQG